MNIATLAEQINGLARTERLGSLQGLREKVRGKNPRTHKIFSKATIKDTYAFHDGGRTELQFNVGLETRGGLRFLRHGVAFSFDKSHTLPDPSILRKWVRPFNVWVESNADALREFRMWHDSKGVPPSDDRPPNQILEGQLKEFVDGQKFVFLGTRVPESEVDVNQILRDLDRLFPLYEFCLEESLRVPAPFRARSKRRVSSKIHTTASRLAGEIDVDLRHKLLQGLLVEMLEVEFSGCLVHYEYPVARGCSVDVAVETPGGFLFCEIKVAPTVREALRPAIGQLLEYAHWPNELRDGRWWVMAEKDPSAGDISYLNVLRNKYSLPVFYRRIDAEDESLGPET